VSSVLTATAADLQLPLEQHLSRTVGTLEAYGHVVVLAPPDPRDPVRRRLHTMRSVLDAGKLAIVPVDLPPLATGLLAEQLRQLAATDLGPGVLAGAARLLTHYLHCGAVLGSLARLDRVRVGVGTHLKSLVPGRQYVVLAHPETSLAVAGPDTAPPGPGFLTQLAVAAAPGADPGWVTGTLAPAWRAQHVRPVPLPEESARWWGTGKLVEFAAYIADVGMLYQLVASVRRDRCGWCGLDVIGDQCPYCAARPTPPPTGPPAPPATRTGGAGTGAARTGQARTGQAPAGGARTGGAGPGPARPGPARREEASPADWSPSR
jgi:hypothetical protein